MKTNKRFLIIIPICILLGGFLLFNFFMPKDFKKVYNEENDLVTTFFQLYKTDFLKDEKTVNKSQNNINYKRDLIAGDLRQLTMKDGAISYSYDIAPKGKTIHFVVRIDKPGIDDILSGEILNDNKLNIRKFNSEVASDKTQSYYEKEVIKNLRLIFNEMYDNS
ncbi:hypothetical protein JZO66_04035 [Enterococcus sp. DIV0242_7C1]|uniref:DUF1310 domain-containing protein n=1 Tax=Candidatus Enterococcus dunnyi TaxID=1834192 RepID=A0AAQ3W780_9ENTE|nr:hypothetical protein [Enterococcus sp. DIV0242_7C1]MBO0469704.1 hypothetical protein [Enterococcus sp. DIV0242_7C1]